MSDITNINFTSEEVANQAQSNFSSLSLVIGAYLKEHALSLGDFWSFVGKRYAPSWEEVRSAEVFAQVAALNMVSLGCDLYSSSGDDMHAEAVFTGWPSKDSLDDFGLTQEEADNIWRAFRPIAEHVGLEYEWHRQGDQVTIKLSQ